MSKRSRAWSSGSTIRSLLQRIHSPAPGGRVGILAAACLGVWLAGWMSPASAQDSDGDGLSDADELSRVRALPFGPPRLVTKAVTGDTSIFATDLDGDGDPDVLSASEADDTIAWYENRLDETGADFGPQQVITTAADGAWSVFAADLDGDGDPDVLSASQWDNKIAWYENRLDEESADFGSQRVITTAVDRPLSIFAADLDGDGDLDAISGSWNDNKIAWYENRLNETSADFGPQQVITTAFLGVGFVFAADLDGDGDPDVLSASPPADKVAWYENRLNETSADFGWRQVITANAASVWSVIAADLDGDGDPDVLSASWHDDKIAWYENRLNETSADFGPQQLITRAADGAWSVFAADLDGDGDPDILSTSYWDNKIAWYENRLNEASTDFGSQRVITMMADGATSVFAADMDGDGDLDVLASASNSDFKIAWYENPGTNPLDPDTDDDGVSDGDEVHLYASDPHDPDSDDDGLSDGEEVNLYGSDPTDVDSDDDGLPDGDEVNLYGSDPTNVDSDGDGLHDGFEWKYGFDLLSGGDENQDPDLDGLDNLGEQSAGTNPLDPDSDADGLSDGDELFVHATNPLDPDTDRDGLSDGDEFLVYGTDLLNLDTDGDGLSDGKEVNEYGGDPVNTDTDGDGLSDGEEAALVRTAPFGPQRLIPTSATQLTSVSGIFAADLDGDGDQDVLSALRLEKKITWYENRLNEATADIGSEQVIATDVVGPRDVFAVDLDGDGDPDVLSAFDNYSGHQKIAWYENRLDESSANFGPQQVIATGAGYTPSIIAADLDGDGDPDVLSVSDEKLAWYENRLSESSADFGPERLIRRGRFASVFATDLDGDGDRDVLSASYYYDEIAWYENRLHETTADFGPQQVITLAADGAVSVFAADLDRDGHPDVLSASDRDHKIAWYENRLDEASANFGPQQLMEPTVYDHARVVSASDLDGDGDPDILAAFVGRLAWYENRLDEPSMDFGLQRLITTSLATPQSFFAIDLDGDGDPDALSASYDNKLAWYENPGTRLFDPDTDDDGLSDGDEVKVYGTNPLAPDSDKDGLSDEYEVHVSSTNPLSPDTDGDGLFDGFEVANGFNPFVGGEAFEDPDVDGLNNLAEQAAGTDPRDADTDDDGLLDGFEVTNAFNPLASGEESQDPDADGLDNLAEQSAGTDPHDADTDGDSIADGDEVNVYATDPANPDTDGDGLRDDFEITNGFDPLRSGEEMQDPDADGLNNLAEQAAGTDPHVEDTDEDGLTDFEEVKLYATNPLNPDSDADKLSDGAEVSDFGTNPRLADTDGGGRSDGREVLLDGTDPLNPYDDILIGLYSISRWDPYLYVVDENTGWTIWELGVPITLEGTYVHGGNGLATNPLTGELWALLRTDYYGQGGRLLVTLDPLTGIATRVGNTGDNFAGLAFDRSGVLYGVTGDGANVPESLFTLSLVDGSATFVRELGNGTEGEAIAYHDDNGLLYHASGCCVPNDSQIFESVDLETLAVTPIPLSGFNFGHMRALTYDGTGLLGAGEDAYDPWGYGYSYQEFVRLGVAGEAESIGWLNHVSKGLAFVFVDSDLDGLTDAKELWLGTDRYKQDTDGDHFPDGEEAALGTDPLNRYAFPITVGLDIKPGSDSNPINESGQGNLPVAILGSETFDVTSVDVTTLFFGPEAAVPSHDLTKSGVFEDHLEDVNRDGFTDLLTHYQTEQTGILHEDLEACIVGKTRDREPFVGCDAIRDVPGRRGLRR